MAASKSGNTPSEAQASNNSNKNIENSLIKHQGQKWQQFFDFDKMLKQIRVAEKQQYRTKGDSSSHSNGKSSSSNSHGSSSSSKSSSTSSSKGGRSIRQVQRLCGSDMHYYGIIPKHPAANVIVCSLCRGSYTKVGFNNHMMMQHPAAWGAASSKLNNTSTTNDMYNLLSNDNSQDCIREGSTVTTAANEILGSPSDLSGIMSTSSNASSSSSSLSTTSSNTYTATARHKSSKSGGTTAGSSSSGGSSSTSSSRSRSKQSRHSSSSNNNNNNHATSIGIHTSSTASAENTQTTSKSSKKSSSSATNSTTSNNNKNENSNNTPALVVTSASTVTTSGSVGSGGKPNKEITKAILETITTTASTTPIALYSSSSNSSCSLPPTPKLSTTLAEVKSPAFVVQDLADSSVSSSSGEYERTNSSGKTLSSKSPHVSNTVATTAKANTNTVSSSSSATMAVAKEVGKVPTIKELNHFDAQLSELDQAVSSITDSVSVEGATVNKNMKTGGASLKNVMEPIANMPPTTTNIFQMPTTNTITETNSEKLHPAIVASVPSNNMNVVQSAIPTNYVVPQEVVQACENALPHNTSDDNSILTFDDVFDSKFINEILSTADTEIHFDENELDTATVAQQQHQQQQQQQQQQLEQHQVYQHQQQQVSSSKRMRYDEAILAGGQQQQQQQQQLSLQQQQGIQGIEITGEFIAYQQQQQQQHYVPYNVTTLDDLKMFNSAGSLVEQHQQMPTHLQHVTEQQQQQQHQQQQPQQQLTAIDAMQLQQLLYQQQTLNTHYDNGGMVNDTPDQNTLALQQQQQQQQYDQNGGVVSAKQLLDMCATVDVKSNKLVNDFATLAAVGGGGYDSGIYDNMASNFQLYNVPSLTDDNMEGAADHLPASGGEASILMPNLMNGIQRSAQQYMLPSGVGDEQLIYEITDNNQVAVISQQRQQQMLNEFLTHGNYDQQIAADMNTTAATIDSTNAAGVMLQQNNNENNTGFKEAIDDIDADILDFDYSLLDMVKGISSSSSIGSSSGSGSVKGIKTEFNTSGGSSSSSGSSSNSKSYEDIFLNAYLYAGIPKPIAINSFGLVKLPFAAATTFRKHILNTRKANNSPITLSGGGGINGIVCANSSTAARLSSGNSSKSMQNYFSNLTSSSNASSLSGGNEFSIGSITITNSSVSQSQLYAAQQKQQSNGAAGNSISGSNNNCSSGNGGIEITFNTNSNGCGSAMSPVSSTLQRSRSKSGNNSASGSSVAAGGATLVRSKSQTGAPVAVVTPTSRLPPPPPRPSTAGPVLAQSSKTIFVSNTTTGSTNDRVKFIKRCMPLVSSSNNNSRADGSKKPKLSPRQIADLLGGVSTNSNGSGHSNNNNRSGSNHKSSTTLDASINGYSNNHEMSATITNNNNSNATTTNNSNNANNHTTNSDEQLKADHVARFYERRRKLYDMARNTRQQQQQQQQQRTQPPQMQQKLLKQQQQLFKMLTDYGQLNATKVGNCKSANANANANNNNTNNGSEILRISV